MCIFFLLTATALATVYTANVVWTINAHLLSYQWHILGNCRNMPLQYGRQPTCGPAPYVNLNVCYWPK